MNVYVVRTVGHEAVKIGKAIDTKSRIADLQTGCPLELAIVTIIPCKSNAIALTVEAIGHDCLQSYEVRGEWFKPPEKALESAIEMMMLCAGGLKTEPTPHQRDMIERSIRNSRKRHRKRWKARRRNIIRARQ